MSNPTLHSDHRENTRPAYDTLMTQIADYVWAPLNASEVALKTAQLCLADALGCAMSALSSKACKALLGSWVFNEVCNNGVPVIGTGDILDPIKAAFDIGTMIRWHDYNDTWLAKEWAHPSDNLGALLSVMDYVNRNKGIHQNKEHPITYTVRDLLEAMIKAYEIQGVLALSHSFNQDGLDHVVLVKLASAALAIKLWGGSYEQIQAAISQVWVDGQSLRTYRHAPNTASRKSWAAGDATSRGVRLALMTLQGEPGYPSALTAPRWGFQDVALKGKQLQLIQPLGCYVMENILFKIAYPAEFHAQTAIECAVRCYEWIKNRWDEIDQIHIETHESALRIIDKKGPLYSPADRDHCMQYMVAVALLKGNLTIEDYHAPMSEDVRIERLRERMNLREDKQFTEDYHDSHKRSIANRLIIILKNGEKRVEVCEFPLGHPRRRSEGEPLLWEKFNRNIANIFDQQAAVVLRKQMQSSDLQQLPISEFIDYWQPKLS